MPRETVPSRQYRGSGRFRGQGDGDEEPDRAIARLAEMQHGVVARPQLTTLGLGDDAIDYRLAVGRLWIVMPRTFAVGHRRLPPHGRSMAAVLSSGAGAVLSHRSAAALWGIRDPGTGPIHVTVPSKSSSTRLVRRHHQGLPHDEVTVHEGIPVTTVPRTVLDLASAATVDEVEVAIRQVEFLRLYDYLSLPDLIERYPGRRGVARVQTALARTEALPAGRVRSPLETKFLPFLRRHRLPRPRLNDWIVLGAKRFQVDCHWVGTGQVVELDSWQGHGTRTAFREDRARDRTLRAAGYEVTRISWAQLDDEPEAVAADLRRLLDHRRCRDPALGE
jgi:very-short-patch-repair endonuclease